MVVVENARKMIGKTIDISVTSVLQTTAGKMIFGKWDDRGPRMDSRPSVPVVTTVAGVPNIEGKKPQPLLTEHPAE
jgi:hypothetical protein